MSAQMKLLRVDGTSYRLKQGKLCPVAGDHTPLVMAVGDLVAGMTRVAETLEYLRVASLRRVSSSTQMCGPCAIMAHDDVVATANQVLAANWLDMGERSEQWATWAEDILLCDMPGGLWSLTHHVNLPFKEAQLAPLVGCCAKRGQGKDGR